MLPHEAEVTAAIATKYHAQIDGMTALHNAVMTMLSGDSWAVTKKRGLAPFVAITMIGLLTKACKTFRAVQILCERGLPDDASALVRGLMETTIAVAFILQKNSKRRALIYHAHGIAQGIRMLEDWGKTPGLKRKAPKGLIGHMRVSLADSLSKLPQGTDVTRHWSGKSNLREAMKALRGDVMYATLFRYTSAILHGADFGNQFEMDPATDEPIWQIEPEVKGFEAPSYAARELLWATASRIDDRFGLGFGATLAPHKLSRKDVSAGQK